MPGLESGPAHCRGERYLPPRDHASQTVTFDGHTNVGFEAGVNLFFARHAGLQLLFDRGSPDLEGTNGPYDVTLHYISRPPPDNQAIPVTVNNSTPWPDTTGSITQSTFGVNGVVRVGTSSRIDATLSGGMSIQHLSGTVQPLGFTQYNLGGDLNVHVARHVALLFGYRYLGGPSVDMPVHVASVLNPEEITFAQTIADIERWLAPAPAHVHIAGWHVLGGEGEALKRLREGFIPLVVLEDHLQCRFLGGVPERVIGLHDVRQREAVRDQLRWKQPARLHDLTCPFRTPHSNPVGRISLSMTSPSSSLPAGT